MENLDNLFTKNNEDPIVEEVLPEAPIAEEAPIIEIPVAEVTPEPIKEEEAPAVEEAKPEPTAISTSDFGRSTTEVQGVGPVANGAIGVAAMQKPAAKKAAPKKPAKEDTVAIHSTKNVTWEGIGKVYRGYNIVTKEAADKWLTRNHTRIATPEEVAKEFGK